MARRLRRIFNPTLSFITEQKEPVKKELEALISQFQKLFTDIEDNFNNLGANVAVEEGPNIRVELDADETTATVSAWRSRVLTSADSPFTVNDTMDETAFLCDASSGDIDIQLDPAASMTDKLLWFKKTDATVNTVTIFPDSGDAEGIEQLPSVVLSEQYDLALIYSDSVDGWLNVTCCPLEPGTFAGPVCSSAELLTMPSAAAPVGLTPSGSIGVPGAWVELTPATVAPWILAGVTYRNGDDNITFTIALGIGAAGLEVEIGSPPSALNGLSGVVMTVGQDANNTILFPAPWRGQVPQGERVVARITTNTTDTSTWTCKALYYEGPVTRMVTTSASQCSRTGTATITPSGSSWGNSAWTQLAAASGVGWSLIGVLYNTAVTGIEFEIDVGIGASGAETLLTTYRGQIVASLSTFGQGPNRLSDRLPVFPIPDGVRLSARLRKTGTAGNSFFVQACVAADVAIPDITSDQPVVWAPSAANSVSVTTGATGVFGSWAQVLAATGDDCCIVEAAVSLSSAPTAQFEIEIGIGAAASEVGIGLVTFVAGSNTVGDKNPVVLPIPRNVATGQRIAVRTRSVAATTSVLVALGYVELPSFPWRSGNDQSVYPLNATVTVAGANVAWADSAWSQLVASSVAAPIMVTGMTFHHSMGPIDIEVDLGIGGGGSETVIYTYCNRMASLANIGVSYWPFPAPLCVAASQRISFRVRKSGTNTGNMSAWITYVPE